MIRVRVEVGKNIKKCCVDKDLDTDRSAAIYRVFFKFCVNTK